MPSAGFLFVVFIIIVALAFDFTNGMHDAANSIATVVSTRVLTPRQAVIWAAKRMSAVRWGVTLRIVWARIFTIPGASLTAGAAYFLIRLVDTYLG